MFLSVLSGIVLLVSFLILIKWYVQTEPQKLKKTIKWIVIYILIALSIFLAVTGRLAAAFGLITGVVAFGWRLFNILSMFHRIRSIFFNTINFSNLRGGSGASPGRKSNVETNFLKMTLDHDTGDIDGLILNGDYSGSNLSSMKLMDIIKFRSTIIRDPDSISLVDAYLDRVHPGWRDEHSSDNFSDSSNDYSNKNNIMNEEEALKVLGLDKGAGKNDIKRAYKILMSKVHPDLGGSSYLASKINQAKDLLLKL